MATYALLTSLFSVVLLAVVGVRVKNWRALAMTGLVLLVLTIVFDSIIVRLGIVAYDNAQRSGVNLGLAPIEDYLYTLLVLFLVPSLWYGFGRVGSLKSLISSGRTVIKKLILVSRPISWLNTAYPFAVGYIAVTGRVDSSLVVGTVYFLFPYNLLMYGVNDVYDYESDIKNPRKGGVEGMREQRAFHPAILRGALATNLPFLAYLYANGTVLANVWLTGVVFMVLAYSVPYLRFKERAFIDSITSSAHFVGPLVYGLVLAGNTLSHMPYIVAFFLWGMASHAFGAVQDILPDRKAGISSVATKIGARYTVWFATVAYAISTVLVGLQGGLATVAAIPFIAYVLNTARFWQLTDRTSARANQGWKVFIYTNYGVGFLLTLILIYAKLR